MTLSVGADKLFTFLKEKFIKEGYCFLGSISIHTVMEVLDTYDFKIMSEVLEELERNQFIEKSEDDTFAIQLSSVKRKDLLEKHQLKDLWLKDHTACFIQNGEQQHHSSLNQLGKKGQF